MLPVGHPFRLVDQVAGGPVSYLSQSSGCNQKGPNKIYGWTRAVSKTDLRNTQLTIKPLRLKCLFPYTLQ